MSQMREKEFLHCGRMHSGALKTPKLLKHVRQVGGTRPTVMLSNYRPQTKFAKVMFLQVSVILSTGGGHAWLLWEGVCMFAPGGVCGCSGGMHGCSRGGCGCSGGHAWLLPGGVCGCSQGGMHGCSWGGGQACMVAPSGGVWLLWGGVHGCSWGVCMVAPGGGMCGCSEGGHAWLLGGGMRGFFDEIRSMSGWYASYWNAYLFLDKFTFAAGDKPLVCDDFLDYCLKRIPSPKPSSRV